MSGNCAVALKENASNAVRKEMRQSAIVTAALGRRRVQGWKLRRLGCSE
jgi:hypothetical protein